LIRVTTPAGGRVEYGHDRLGRVTTVAVVVGADRFETVYTYDAEGAVTEIEDPNGGLTTFMVDAAGRRTERHLPNGVSTLWAYDDRDRITAIEHLDASSAVLASRAYVRGATGEPTRIDREDGSHVEVGYDGTLRVSTETHRDAGGAVVRDLAYFYDADGNRAVREADGVVESYAYAPGALLSAISAPSGPLAAFGYDPVGRTTAISRAGASYNLGYDPDGNVTSIDDAGARLSTYSFDAEGRRERVEHAGTERRYLVAPCPGSGLECIHAVLDPAGNVVRVYVYDTDQPVMRFGPGGATTATYYLEDAMGSVIGLADDTGASTATFTYDGFGNALSTAGPAAALPSDTLGDFRFHAMWLDPTGLYFVRARSYDPETGRFVSRDPAAADISRVESSYAYILGLSNPLLASDPTGRFATSTIELHGVILIQATLAVVAVASAACVQRAILSSAGVKRDGTPLFDPFSVCDTGDEMPDCASEHPNLILCSDLPVEYRFPSRRAALDELKRYHDNPHLRYGSDRAARWGPCRGRGGRHINVLYRSESYGSIRECPCCEDRPDGPLVRTLCELFYKE
jgi:RHS repeat-associated protein